MMNFGWDNRGFARKTGVPAIDAVLGSGDLQDAQDCNYAPVGVFADLGVDVSHGAPKDQYAAGIIWLESGAVLERGRSMASVWACTRLPDGHREPCNGSCRCCQVGTGGYCEGHSTCPEHCPIGKDAARAAGMLAEHPRATRPESAVLTLAAELYHTRYGGCGFNDETPSEQGWWLRLAEDLQSGVLPPDAKTLRERDEPGNYHISGGPSDVNDEWYRLVARVAEEALTRI